MATQHSTMQGEHRSTGTVNTVDTANTANMVNTMDTVDTVDTVNTVNTVETVNVGEKRGREQRLIHYPDSTMYEGNMVGDRRHGMGACVNAVRGCHYVGEWVDDMPMGCVDGHCHCH